MGSGVQTSALAYGGAAPTGVTEQWNGTNWTEANDLNTARLRAASAGATNTSALASGGVPAPGTPSDVALVEQWSVSGGVSTIDLS
jgi:hypothetical protein